MDQIEAETETKTTRRPGAYNRFINQLVSAWRAGMLCRCSVVSAIIVCVALQQSQSVESLFVLAEDSGVLVRRLALLGISAICFSIACWYGPRLLQYRLAPGNLTQRCLATFISKQLPRICAVAPLLALSTAFNTAGGPRNGAHSSAENILTWTAISTGVAAVLMYVLLALRTSWVASRRPALLGQWIKARGESPLQPPLDNAGAPNVIEPPETPADMDDHAPRSTLLLAAPARQKSSEGYRVTPLRLLPWETIVAALLITLLAIALLVLFIIRPQSAAWFGPMTILFASALLWVTFGTIIAYVGTRLRLPLFLLLIALGCLFSGFDWNDNHEVRHSMVRPVPPENREFRKTFDEWLSTRPDLKDFADNGYPVVIVCCEGGGLYAAYHSAYQLASIQDANRAFASHIFAISAVSGGSLGSAVFAGLVHRYGTTTPPQGSMKAAVSDVLADDFLSPVLATALYPDLLQRAWPRPIPSFDRARALEQGFERAWTAKTGGHEFEAPFDDLTAADVTHAAPYLILNSTCVESGGRAVVTQLPFDAAYFSTISSITDMHPGVSLALSTAVGLSSRFPYLSPAGYLRTPRGDKLRYVDGGYFEDTGAATTLDLLNALREERGRTRGNFRFIVVRIGLSYNPRDEKTSLLRSLKYTWNGLGESLSPVRALLNTRTARGTAAVQLLYTDVFFRAPRRFPSDIVFDFPLTQRNVPMPLGWLMSEKTRREVEDQVKRSFYARRVLQEISPNSQ